MNNSAKDFLEEIGQLEDQKFIFELSSSLGEEYEKMIEGDYGEKIVETGKAMLDYLFDLLKRDIDLGMDAIKVIYCGYPNIPYTDLITPSYDSITTRRLWYRATEELDMDDRINQALIVNTFFRWYISTYEFYRKMLIFDCYCHGLYTGHHINVKNFLFSPRDPSTILKNEGSKERNSLIECYYSELRHSISHGNIAIIPGHFIVVRETDDKKENMNQIIYDDSDKLIQNILPNIEIMYGSIRFFYYILINYLSIKYIKLFKKYIGKTFNDPVLIAVVQSIQEDLKKPVY